MLAKATETAQINNAICPINSWVAIAFFRGPGIT